SYTDPYGTNHLIIAWKPYSSLESELAKVDTISSWQMMGDQSYLISGHFTVNPYYGAAQAFSHANYDMRLTARLDGYSVSDVNAAVDRAQQAFVGPTNSPAGPFHFLVDNDPSKNYAPTMSNLVTGVLQPAGMPVTYDNTSAFVGTTTGPL